MKKESNSLTAIPSKSAIRFSKTFTSPPFVWKLRAFCAAGDLLQGDFS
jgi:hypothetical protein